MNKKGDNKIGIPWYKRNVSFDAGDDMGINNPVSFNLPVKPRTRPRTRTNVKQPQTEPATQPATQPATKPAYDPLSNPLKLPFPFPLPFPPIGKNPNPAPEPNPAPAQKQPFNNPVWATWTTDPAAAAAAAAAPEKKNPAQQVIQNILKPIVFLFAAREVANQYVKVNVTDPIYKQMLQDPVLGTVLREGEKANLDAGQLGTILANFDWQKGDYKQLEKQLALGIGVAGAARIMVFIIGRKVVFRM